MEANKKIDCDFKLRGRNGETWRITGCWKTTDNKIAWWDGECFRDGVKFYRIFDSFEIASPEIAPVEGYDTVDPIDV